MEYGVINDFHLGLCTPARNADVRMMGRKGGKAGTSPYERD